MPITINLDQIAREIAGELEFPISKTKNILEEALEEIAIELKEKKKVRLNGFGTLVIKTRKSRRIVQVNTQNSRLLLAHDVIGFKPLPEFRAALAGKQHAPDGRKSRSNTPRAEIKVTATKTIIEKPSGQTPSGDSIGTSPLGGAKPKAIKLKATLELKPLPGFLDKVDKKKIEAQIRERMIKIAKLNALESKKIKPAGSAATRKVLAALIKKMQTEGSKGLGFSLENKNEVDIYTSRPRRKLATLPKETIINILQAEFELEDFGLPQERFARIDFGGKMKIVYAHSLPTDGGMSVVIRITN